MHKDYSGRPLYSLQYEIDDQRQRLLADRQPGAQVKRVLGEGDVVQVLDFSHAGGDRWAAVDTLRFQNRTPTPDDPRTSYRDYARGFLRLPGGASESVLAPVPFYRYYENIVSGGLPSHIAVGDTVILIEGYPDPGEAIHTVVPVEEAAEPSEGVLSAADVARVVSGPIRTPTGLLYWRIENLNGPQSGYIREYARSGPRIRFILRPHIIARS